MSIGDGHKKRQIRKTLRPSGSDAATLTLFPASVKSVGGCCYHRRAVAKKSRTPAPPRKVQAPQKRADQRRPRTGEDRKRLYLSMAFAASGVIAVVIAAVVVFAFGGKSNGASAGSGPAVESSKLIGLQTGPAPWNTGLDHLPDRLEPLRLTALPQEALTLHIHQHLDIFLNGRPVTVPSGIGVYDGQFITELHTHAAGAEGLPGPANRPTGVIHVESPTKTTYNLGQFFGVWGVRFTRDCIGGYCKELTPWRLYVNGKLFTGDPTRIPLKEHEEFAIVIGKPPKKIPSTFDFGKGL
jgi:hypothetical protein